VGLGGEASYVAHSPDDLRCQDRPDPKQLGQARGGFFDRLPDAAFEFRELPVQAPNISERSAASLRRVRAGPTRERTPRSARAARSAERFFGAPPGRRSLSSRANPTWSNALLYLLRCGALCQLLCLFCATLRRVP
jgi:hypothetical protein